VFLSAVITIKHVSIFVNKVENPYVTMRIFDLIDKCRYVFYGYDGIIWNFFWEFLTIYNKLKNPKILKGKTSKF
jgi:hypothetical protein